jgi:hypothetical protein
VTGIAALAKVLHAAIEVSPKVESAILHIGGSQAVRAASV